MQLAPPDVDDVLTVPPKIVFSCVADSAPQRPVLEPDGDGAGPDAELGGPELDGPELDGPELEETALDGAGLDVGGLELAPPLLDGG